MKLIECVPNFSEGRRPEVVSAIRDAIAAVEGVTILDASSDVSHNRSVITFVAPAENAVQAAFEGIKAASERIDLREHTGYMQNAEVVTALGMGGAMTERWAAQSAQVQETTLAATSASSRVAAVSRAARQAVQVLMLSAGAWLVQRIRS